jgi:penicillin-binding protein
MLPEDMDSSAAEEILAIEGAGIDRKAFGTIRVYPFGSLMAHTLGYVGPVGEDELKSLEARAPGQYNADSIVGKSGLEYAYESELRGTDGREYYIAGENGEKKSVLYTIPAKDGLDLHLSVDTKMQKRLEEVVSLSLASYQTGAVIALNPATGAIKALCSYPGFDPNVFVRGITEDDWKALNDEANHLPLFNRLTRGLYPPGSILKPFTAASFLDSGAITANTVFDGEIEEDHWTPKRSDWYYPSIKRVEIRNRPTPLNLENAMITSDNIFFAFAALETGEERFVEYMDKLGMNEAMPFDLALEAAHIKREATEFNIKFLADSGYGQGEVLITPMQMAAMFTALDKGDILIPSVVERVYRTDGNDYTLVQETGRNVWKPSAISQSALGVIKPSLEKVITEGTGHTLGLNNRRIAGKTGTAQVGSREVSWFAAYTLDRDEPLLVIVVIDTDGGVVKFDIVREMLEY